MSLKQSEKNIPHQDISEFLSGLSRPDVTDIQDLERRNRLLEDTRQAIFNILEDVSDSEKELKNKTEELQKFRQAVDTSFDHVVITDVDGYVFYANHAAELLTGYSKKEIIGQTPALWGKQMPLEFYETFWRTIKEEKNSYAGELTNKRKDGTRYLTSLRVAPILNEKNDIQFFVGIERDITEERKSQLRIVRHAALLERANAAIAKEKDRTESILRFLKSIGEGVFAADKEGRIIFMNESAEMMSGKSFEEVRTGLVQETFVFIDRSGVRGKKIAVADLALKRKKTVTFPHKTFIVRGTKEIPVSGTCSLIRDEQQQIIGTITVFHDVTKKHELEQMKDGFLSVAAHQLRTPLGSMRWSMELLLGGDLGRLPKQAKEAVQHLYDNSKRMGILVNDLLNVARMDESKWREEKEEQDVIPILEDVLKTLRPEAEKFGVTLSLKKEKKPFPVVMIPPRHFHEAFENLISNGIKYNRKDGRVTLAIAEEADGLLITVTDTGIGIPKDAQGNIFSKFFRASNAVLKETEGSGLGLSVVKSYVEETGGSIRFESTENVGTVFFVKIPFGSKGV